MLHVALFLMTAERTSELFFLAGTVAPFSVVVTAITFLKMEPAWELHCLTTLTRFSGVDRQVRMRHTLSADAPSRVAYGG